MLSNSLRPSGLRVLLFALCPVLSASAQLFVGSQPATFDPSSNTTTFAINVAGAPGQMFKLRWERDYGTSAFTTTLAVGPTGFLSAAVPIGMPPGTLDRIAIDGLDDAPIDICDGNWQPPPPSPISLAIPARAPAPLAAPQGCHVFQLTGSQVVPAVATTSIGVATLFFDIDGNLKLTVHHNVANATSIELHMGAAGTNGPTVFSFGALPSPSRAFTPMFAGTTPQGVAPNLSNFYITVNSASGQVLRGQTAAAANCALFMSEFCSTPLAPTAPNGGIDPNADGVRDDCDDQFIEIVNGRDLPVDLSGFQIRSGGLIRHVFPLGTRLLPGEAIVVFGGGQTAIFDSMGHRGVTASSGGLFLGEVSDTIDLLGPTPMSVVVDTITYSVPVGGRSRTRSPETPGSPFVPHNTVTPDRHSAGRFNNNVIIYPPSLAFVPGNFSDVAMVTRINGSISSPILHRHDITTSDALNITFLSPLGSLTGAPFAAFAQLIPTNSVPAPIPLPGDVFPSVIFSPMLPVVVVIDGLTNPSALFNPVIGTSLSGSLPAALGGQGLTLTLQCLVRDVGLNALMLGTASPHRFEIF